MKNLMLRNSLIFFSFTSTVHYCYNIIFSENTFSNEETQVSFRFYVDKNNEEEGIWREKQNKEGGKEKER